MSLLANFKIEQIQSFLINGSEKNCVIKAEIENAKSDNGEDISGTNVELYAHNSEITRFFELLNHVSMQEIAEGDVSIALKVNNFDVVNGAFSADIISLEG